MKSKKTQFMTVVLLAGVLLVGLIVLNGCKKSEPTVIAQTTCPVMGSSINKDIFTEYKARKSISVCPRAKRSLRPNPKTI